MLQITAKELQVNVGDTFEMQVDGQSKKLTICGIYSDITNGGKTAKACFEEHQTPAMWSIFYLDTPEGVSQQNFMQKLNEQFREWNLEGVEAVDIRQYVNTTYSQTLEQVDKVSKAAKCIALLILMVVIALFSRMITAKERFEISFQKALGFSTRSIWWKYMKTNLIFTLAGILLGILLGNSGGEKICQLALQSFGADRFSFLIDIKNTLIVTPVLVVFGSIIAGILGLRNVRNVRAYECCRGKD